MNISASEAERMARIPRAHEHAFGNAWMLVRTRPTVPARFSASAQAPARPRGRLRASLVAAEGRADSEQRLCAVPRAALREGVAQRSAARGADPPAGIDPPFLLDFDCARLRMA